MYSTRGGTSGKTILISSPLSSIYQSWEVSTFWLTLPMDLFNSPNRFVPGSKSLMISTFHLSLMSVSVVSTGQAGKVLDSMIISSCLLVSKMLYSPILLYLPRRGQDRGKIFYPGKKPNPLEITQSFPLGNCPIVTFKCLYHNIVRTFQMIFCVVCSKL